MKLPKILKMPKIKLPTKQQVKAAMPTILAVVSVVGNTATAILLIKETSSATLKIEQMKAEGATKQEIVKEVAPKFILPAITFAASQLCTIECNILNKKQQMGLSAALVGADYRYRRYKEKVRKECGPEEDRRIEDEIAKEDFHEYAEVCGNLGDGSSKYVAPEGTLLFYDPYRNSGKEDGYFSSTMIQVKQAMYHLNRNYILASSACLNEFYEFLGIPGTAYGEYAWWDMADGVYWIDIEIREVPVNENTVAYAIDYVFAPQVPMEAIEKGLV